MKNENETVNMNGVRYLSSLLYKIFRNHILLVLTYSSFEYFHFFFFFLGIQIQIQFTFFPPKV